MPTPPVSPPASPATVANLEAALLARLRANKIKIPTYPAVAAKLQRLANSGTASMGAIAGAVAVDPALAAAVLGRANSVAHAGSQVATTLTDAVQRVGIEQVIQMAISAGLGDAAITVGPLATLRREVWRCALLAGRIAYDLAARRRISPEHAFLAGLLHDFGAVVVICGLEDIAKEVPLPTMSDLQWHQLVDKLQVQFGLVVAARWHLPEAITDVIAHHRDPAVQPTPLVALIKIVDQVIAILDRSPAVGVGALLEVKELATDERYAIGAALPDVVKQMESYSINRATANAPTNATPEPRRPDEEWWQADFDVVQSRHDAYRARRVAANAIELVCREPLAINWLAEVTIHTGSEPFRMMINVKTCTQEDGHFVVVAQPFGLGGDQKKAWLQLLQVARVTLSRVA